MKYFRKLFILILTIISLTKFISGGDDEYADDDSGGEIDGDVPNYMYDEEYNSDNHVDYYDGSQEIKMKLPETCISLQYLKLKRICDSFYPSILAENFGDILAKANEPYAVFQFPYEDTNRYFLTFQHSDIFYCQSLQVVDVLNYRCFNETSVPIDINMDKGIMQCMHYGSEAIDLLLGICSTQLNESAVFSALHYSNLLTLPRSAGGKENLRIEWCLHVAFVTLWYIFLSTKNQ